MTLLDTARYTISQRAKLVELTAQFDISSQDGQAIGTVTEVGHGGAHKAFRALTGADTFLNRHLEVRDNAGALVAVVSRNRGLWRSVVTVCDAHGREAGRVRIRLFAPSLPLPMGHQLLDGSGQVCGKLRTHGLRRRRFTLELDGAVVARATQPWAGAVQEMLTQADRYTFERIEQVPVALLPLVFALPLAVELAFKQGGGVSPLGEATSAVSKILDF